MEITNIIKIKTRKEWREWLFKNSKSETFCWVEVNRKKSGDGLAYLDAVEEALCFGWIDSTVKNGYQRFSKRTKNSNWTELNKIRVERLEKLGLMTDDGLSCVPKKSFEIHKEVLNAIKEDQKTYENFLKLPKSYIRIKIDNIQSHIKTDPKIYESRLQKFLENTKLKMLYGQWNYGGRL